MQDDMEATPQRSSRFDLRHRRPLPKSEGMKDLRTPKTVNKKEFPLPSTLHAQTIQTPTEEKSILSNPIILWIIGLALGLIFSTVLIAILANN